jgi:hypothetical protein
MVAQLVAVHTARNIRGRGRGVYNSLDEPSSHPKLTQVSDMYPFGCRPLLTLDDRTRSMEGLRFKHPISPANMCREDFIASFECRGWIKGNLT